MIALTDFESWSLDWQYNEITTPHGRGMKLQKVKPQSLSLVHEAEGGGRVKSQVRKGHMEGSITQALPIFS